VITTLLFDLDNTLLGNDMGTFLPAYFRKLTSYFPAGPGQPDLIAELVTATRAMVANADPARDLFGVFDECFSQRLGRPREEWWPVLTRFYDEAYRELEAVTTRRPEARAVMEWAFRSGYEVAVTTSPLFPLPAIRERLRWAGVQDFPYALVTSLDDFHFAKSRPEFYAEVLGRLGRRPEQALVVGDDWTNDIVSASAAGLATYRIAPGGRPAESALPGAAEAQPSRLSLEAHPLGSGTLAEFLAWAPEALPHLPEPGPPPGPSLPYLLAGNLAVVVGALAGLADAQWRRRPRPAEWSLTEIICHLRDVDREVNLPRLRAVVESDNPFVAAADTDPWARERDYQAQSGPQALRAFVDARRQAAHYLQRQPEAVWSRTARHAIFGPTMLVEIVGWILDHDRIHLQQIRETKAKASA
jgi:FMN phosphatase YigB (HAD superfamily)